MTSSWKVWLGFFVCLSFAMIGALMVLDPRKPEDVLVGWTCALFFIMAAGAFAHTLWTRRQNRAFLDADQVTLTPGARFTLKRGRMAALGFGVVVLGALAVLNARVEADGILLACGVLFLAGGLSLLALLASGVLASHYLLFEPGGLRVGDRRGSVLIAWDNLGRLEVGEYQGNPVLRFWFKDAGALALTAQGRSRRWGEEKLRKAIRKSRAWVGCDWMVLTWQYGLNAMLLAKAVVTYVRDPEIREGLRKQLEIQGE